MSYSFQNLSPADFEDLTRDLIGRELGVRFEAFAPGPDGGMDGRHAIGIQNTVLQAKHYVGSAYSALKSTMKKERNSIDKLAPSRYILATSHPLSPDNKEELATIIGPSLKSEADIFGPQDLNDLIRKHQDVERSHIKLWLSGTGMLDRIIRSASHEFNTLTKADIDAKVRVYAPNESLEKAQKILENQHVLIISGAPGIGKTTLAEMIAFAYMADEWELVAIRDLNDALSSIDDTKKQVFYFDDFLGTVALDRQALSHRDSDLARFMKRVRHSKNARFILTTRAYIYEEARRVSENLADPKLNISKYLLDVGVYTRRIKARILYNHLLFAGAPKTHIAALVESGELPKIIDHKHYNPRIIEWMTDSERLEDIEPTLYVTAFLDVLDHPDRLWDTAFRTHIPKLCQHLLMALFFCSEYSVDFGSLKDAYDRLHQRLSTKYGDPYDPSDFEEAVRILEGSFISVVDRQVNFVNPSLRDYLKGRLNDLTLLREFAQIANETGWANAVWQQGVHLKPSDEDLKNFADAFQDVASKFTQLPTSKRVKNNRWGFVHVRSGLWSTRRIELLIDWWCRTKNDHFAEIALEMSQKPPEWFDANYDGDEMVNLAGELRLGIYPEDFPFTNEIAANLEEVTTEIIAGDISWEELETISDAVHLHSSDISETVKSALKNTVEREISEVPYLVENIDSESTLEEHADIIGRLGERTFAASESIEQAIEQIHGRIADLAEESWEEVSPSFSPPDRTKEDEFSDTDIDTLFWPLLES
jgi:hypothetical protein